jgi:hypothetical protein
MKKIKGPQVIKTHYKTLYVLFSYVAWFNGTDQRHYVTFPRFKQVLIFGDATP